VKKQRAKKTPPQEVKIAQEAGREYRDISDAALAAATPAELPELVRLFASYADGLHAKVIDRNASARLLISWGKNHDRARCAYFKTIEITGRILERALGPDGSNAELREELLQLASAGLQTQIAAGCPQVSWPDDALFPSTERKPN
jgi:hypothetical protein